MMIALFFLMGYQFFGKAPHEWVGIIMFVLFILHHILNAHWYKTLFKGKYNTIRIITLCIDCLVLIAMLAQLYSGIVMARYLSRFLQLDGGMSLARRLHIFGAYWGFLFINLHLGLHWNMILGIIKKVTNIKNNSKVCNIIMFIISLLITSYGVLVFINRDFLTYLFLKSEFVFLDYSEPKVLFYIDYLTLMGLCIFIAHYSTKIIRKFRKKTEK